MVRKLLLLTFILTLPLFANIGKIVAMKGEATIIKNNQEIEAKVGSQIVKNDEIKTGKDSKLQLLFEDNTVITIGNSSHFKVNDYLFSDKEVKADFGLLKGTFRTITGKIGKVAPSKFKLKSKTSSIGIRGTQILSKMAIEGDRIVCIEGEIIITHLATGKTVVIKAGEFVDLSVDNDSLEVQTLTQEDIQDMDENTRFLLDDGKEVNLDDLGVVVTPFEEIPWVVLKDLPSKEDIEDETQSLFEGEENIPEVAEVAELNDITDPNYIINATHTANYSGHLHGTATDGSFTETIDSLSSTIQLDIDFGASSISGGLYIYTGGQVEITIPHGDLAGTVKADGTGFTLQGPAGTSGNSGIWGGTGSGTFHGAAADTLKGNLNMDNGYGVSFNATFESNQ